MAVVALLATTVTTAIVAPTGAGAASNPAVAEVEPQLYGAAADGPVAVIIELNAPSAGTIDQLDPAGTRGRRSAARLAGDRVINDLATVAPQSAGRTQRVTNFAMFATTVDAAGLDRLAHNPEVARISANRVHAASLAHSVPKIGAPVAFAAGYTGSGQAIAVLDTGVDATHPFLSGRVQAEACFSSTNPDLGMTAICPGSDPTTATGPGSAAPCQFESMCSHGTHVAGIAAGRNSTFTGVAPDATVIAVQIFSKATGSACGEGGGPCARYTDFDLVRGLDYVYTQRANFDIAAVNMSLGGMLWPGPCDFDPSVRPVGALRAAGITPVAAAGNNGDKSSLSRPGCLSNLVSVGATSAVDDSVAPFSNSDPYLTLLAPGVDINSSVPGGTYDEMSGTSMAAPHVSGAVALIRQQHPGFNVDDIVSVLRTTGLPVIDPANNLVTPRIRVDTAVRPPTYHPLSPDRLLDTRTGIGAPAARVGPGGSIDVKVTGRGGVPATGVSAVVLNVTGVQASASTHVTVHPTGSPLPFASNLNLTSGDVRPNLVTAKVGLNGSVTLYNASGSIDLVADVQGWYDDGGLADNGAHHVGLTPVRIADTRYGTGVPAEPVGPGGVITVDVASRCPSPGAVAAALNVTITNPTSATHLTVFPAGQNPPTASNLNVQAGETAPNLVMASLSSTGQVSIRNNSGSAQVIVDLHGCEIPSPSTDPAGRFIAAAPSRIVDTRVGLGVTKAGPLPALGVQAIPVAGRGGVPSTGVRAVALNVTVTNPTHASHLTVLPTDLPLDQQLAAMNTSVLNFGAGQTVPNLVIATLGPDGQLLVTNNEGSVDLVIDVAGWITA